jgi:hypothetical protein
MLIAWSWASAPHRVEVVLAARSSSFSIFNSYSSPNQDNEKKQLQLAIKS